MLNMTEFSSFVASMTPFLPSIPPDNGPNCGCPLNKQKIEYNKLLGTVNGVNGQLYLYENRIIIRRKGVIAKMTQGFFKGEKEIFLSQISGIQVKKAGKRIAAHNCTSGMPKFLPVNLISL